MPKASTRKTNPKKPAAKPESNSGKKSRDFRMRRKAYMADLEKDNARLTSEKKEMEAKLDAINNELEQATKRANYLHSLVANSKEIGRLVQAISAAFPRTNFTVGTSARSADSDPDRTPSSSAGDADFAVLNPVDESEDSSWSLPGMGVSDAIAPPVPPNDAPGGICLHVSGGNVSVEFCEICWINSRRN